MNRFSRYLSLLGAASLAFLASACSTTSVASSPSAPAPAVAAAPAQPAAAPELTSSTELAPRPKGDPSMKPEDTEYYHPAPTVVSAPANGVPSDAVVLFDGTNLDAWRSAEHGGPAPWTVADGVTTIVPKSGDIATKQAFGDIQLHLEFREPTPAKGKSQARGNSGVFFMGLYELQVLDCYDNLTYVNGQTAGLYKQYPPLVNACRPAGEWQTYDCVWIAPRFAADGSVVTPARLTVFHNGVLAQYNIAPYGPTVFVGIPKYVKHADKLPLLLQEHHNTGGPVSFRNIWVRELNLPDSARTGATPTLKTHD